MFYLFFFNDTATTEIYPLPLPDALPISDREVGGGVGLLHAVDVGQHVVGGGRRVAERGADGVGLLRPGHVQHAHPRRRQDRKSTRLNSSHANISYAVFCLKKKKKQITVN